MGADVAGAAAAIRLGLGGTTTCGCRSRNHTDELGLVIGTNVLAQRTFGTAANNNTGDFLASGGTATNSSELNGQVASYYAPIATPVFTTNITSPLVIGSSSANGTLTLQGNSATTGNTATNANLTFNVDNSGSTTAMTILNNRNVGIGSVNPRSALDMGSGGITLGGVTNATWPSGTSQWTGTNPIYFNGNVGIGTTHPQAN